MEIGGISCPEILLFALLDGGRVQQLGQSACTVVEPGS